MLKIQKRISFKDPVGRLYTTDALLLTLEDDTTVYTVENSNRYLYVHLSGQWQPTENQVLAMTGRFDEQLAKYNILWPELECCHPDSDLLCGFLTPRIDLPAGLSTVRELITVGSPDRDTLRHNLKVGLNLARCIEAFHRMPRRMALGAPHPGEFYADAQGEVFSCSAYSHVLDTYIPGDERYLAPEYITGQRGFSRESDAFSFALMLFELLTGAFPFGAHAPEECYDNGQITDMILNGESIFYYANAAESIRVEQELFQISPALPEMFRLAFDYCGRRRYEDLRPSVSDWIEVLEQIEKNGIGYCNSPDIDV